MITSTFKTASHFFAQLQAWICLSLCHALAPSLSVFLSLVAAATDIWSGYLSPTDDFH